MDRMFFGYLQWGCSSVKSVIASIFSSPVRDGMFIAIKNPHLSSPARGGMSHHLEPAAPTELGDFAIGLAINMSPFQGW